MSGKLKLERTKGQPVTDEQLLNDLRAVAKQITKNTVTQKTYEKLGEYEYSTQIRRFGSWNAALKNAGLEITHEQEATEERLFENILYLWTKFGRQPVRSDLATQESSYSQSPYNRKFGSWTKALEAFVEYVNSVDSTGIKPEVRKDESPKGRKASRDPSLRLRYQVLKRDRFSCLTCGASPAKDEKVLLHIDHIKPWSKGGETVIENLQTLCSNCNYGKSDLVD
jgi:predicted restriction endonuclease